MLKNSSEPYPLPSFGDLKGQFIVDTALHAVQLLIMRIIPSENNGFVLVLFDFAFLDEPLFLRPDTFQQSLCRLVRRILRYQLALDCLLQYRLLESLWETAIEILERCVHNSVICHLGEHSFQHRNNPSHFLAWRNRDWQIHHLLTREVIKRLSGFVCNVSAVITMVFSSKSVKQIF